MSTFQGSSGSRRDFLKEAAVVSAAVVGGPGLAAEALAAPPAPAKSTPAATASAMGKATKHDLGLLPHRNVAGAVVVLSEWGTFVTFPEQIAGTAVIELLGCAARTNSYSTNQGQDGRPYSYFNLKPGQIYEVTNSPWQKQVEEDVAFFAAPAKSNGRTTAKAKKKPLRHYVFTFADTTYQCVAEGVRAKLMVGSYGDIVAELMHRGLT